MQPKAKIPKPDQKTLSGVVNPPEGVVPYYNPYDTIMLETNEALKPTNGGM